MRSEIYKTHKCKCPMCGILHLVKMFWTGHGMPRKYCDKCLRIVQTHDLEPVTHPDPLEKKGRNKE